MEKALYVLFPFLKLPFVLKDVKRFVTSKNSCTFALSKDKDDEYKFGNKQNLLPNLYDLRTLFNTLKH